MPATWYEPPPAAPPSARSSVKPVRAPLATREFFIRRVVLGRLVLGEERAAFPFALLSPREGGLAAGVEVAGVVASESGESQGSGVLYG